MAVLRKLGNSGTPLEVRRKKAEKLALSDSVLNEQMKTGSSRFENQVAWARFYLSKAGYLDSSKRGVWSLTDKGISAVLTDLDALDIFKDVQKSFGRKGDEIGFVVANFEDDTTPPDFKLASLADHQEEVLHILRKLPPAGFEGLWQMMLRESGFLVVEITGRTGDGGIDGTGVLQISPLLGFQVIFQCKRYRGSVTASQIRDFRGAMTGRTDKGIFITTSAFTADAEREARREGAPPIELVDANRLVAIMKEYELGFTPKTVYEVDRAFFDEFG
jgi:restriction system protein